MCKEGRFYMHVNGTGRDGEGHGMPSVAKAEIKRLEAKIEGLKGGGGEGASEGEGEGQ
jgi:hypothetical protein